MALMLLNVAPKTDHKKHQSSAILRSARSEGLDEREVVRTVRVLNSSVESASRQRGVRGGACGKTVTCCVHLHVNGDVNVEAVVERLDGGVVDAVELDVGRLCRAGMSSTDSARPRQSDRCSL